MQDAAKELKQEIQTTHGLVRGLQVAKYDLQYSNLMTLSLLNLL